MDIALKKYAEKMLSGTSFFGIEHANRVLEYAAVLSEGKNANQRVIEYSALLHNIGIRQWLKYKNDLLKTSLNQAKSFLSSIQADPKEANQILQAISSSMLEAKPPTIEARILHDSNLLDNIGAIGIMKDSVRAFHEKQPLHSFFSAKSGKLENAFSLPEAREMGMQKIREYKDFASSLER